MKKLKFVFVIAVLLFVSVKIQAQEIITAATNGNLEKVKELVEKDAQLVNAKDANGRTLLHLAAGGVHLEVMKYLVEKGADVNAKDNNNITALASIVSRNNVEAAKFLISKGALLNETNDEKETPLHFAAASGYVELVQILVENNAQLELRNSYNRTPLLLAARECGILDIIKILVERGANINVKDNNFDTPLSLAAWRGFEDIVNYLLEKNVEVSISGTSGKNLFSYALEKRLLNLYKTMLAKGASISDLSSGGNTAIHWAAKGGSEFIVKDLIEKKFNINVKDSYGLVPLHYASMYGRLSVVKVIVENGADINVKSRVEETPINLAQKAGQKEVVKYLISKGADSASAEYTKLKGKYFGIEDPGNTPKLFALGITTNLVSGHSNVTFSPDGEEAFWTEWNETETGYTDGCKIYHSKIENGFWKVPKVIMQKGDTPIFSTDGMKIYFMALTPRREIDYFEIKNSEFTSPKPIPFNLEGTRLYWQFSFDQNENLFFAGGGFLFRAQFKDGKYLAPEKLSEIYHPEYKGGSPFISPSGDYIIFSSGSNGRLDLFIGYRKSDGAWTKPINLGNKINTFSDDHLPIVSPDGKYLFFVSSREGKWGKYWVSAKFIEELRPKE